MLDAFFQAILQDLFPGVEIPNHDYGKLQSAIEDCILAKGLQVTSLSGGRCTIS